MKGKCVFIIVLISHISNVVGADGAAKHLRMEHGCLGIPLPPCTTDFILSYVEHSLMILLRENIVKKPAHLGTLFWKEHCVNKTDENQATVKLIMEDILKDTQEMAKKFDDVEVVYLEVDIEAKRGHENELFETEIFINVNDCSRHDEVNGSMTNDAFHWARIRNFIMRMPKKSGRREGTISDEEVDGQDLVLSRTYRPSFKPIHCFNKTREKLDELIAIRKVVRKLMADLQGKYKELAIVKIQLDIEAVNLKDPEVSYTTVVMNVNDCSEYHTNYTWWSSPTNMTSANVTVDTGPGKGEDNNVNNNASGQDSSKILNNNSTIHDAADKEDKNNSTGIKSDADSKENNSTIDESNGKQNKKNTNGSEDNNAIVDKDGNVSGIIEDSSKGNGTDDDSKVWWVVNPPKHEANAKQYPEKKNSSENDNKNTDENCSKNTDQNDSKDTDENHIKNTDENDSKNTDENNSKNTDENGSKNTDQNDSKDIDENHIKNTDENDSKDTDENHIKNTDENDSKDTDENHIKNTDENDTKDTDENDSKNTVESDSKNTDENDSKSREKSEIDSSSINEDDNLYKGKSTNPDSKKNVFVVSSTLGYIESEKNEEDDADYTGSASSSSDIETSYEHKEDKIKPTGKTKVLSGSTIGIIENHERNAIDDQIYGEYYDSHDNEYKDRPAVNKPVDHIGSGYAYGKSKYVELEGNDISVYNNKEFDDENEDIKRLQKLRNKLKVGNKNNKPNKGKSKSFGYTQVKKQRKHKKPGHYKKKMGNNRHKLLINPNKVKVIF